MESEHGFLPNKALAAAKAEREAELARFEARRLARTLAVPTDDVEVRQALRSRALPICLFGEDAHDRRERLRAILADEILKGKSVHKDEDGESVQGSNKTGENDEQKQEYYTEGSEELKSMRMEIALPSLTRAKKRLERERVMVSLNDPSHAEIQVRRATEKDVVETIRRSYTAASQIGDSRPLSAISYGITRARKAVIATGSWSGTVKVWSGEGDYEHLQTIDTHTERISTVSIPREHPGFLLTSSADGTAALHYCGEDGRFETRLQVREHRARVSDAKMHPFRNQLIATSSFDGSFVLMDNERTVLRQVTGHSQVYRLSFHPDGSLLATCGLDGGVRVWDLRSGRALMTLTKAHADDVLAAEFSGDGRILATGGKDNVVRAWDLRSVQCAKTVAAHRNLIAGLRFGGGPENGDVLFTCGFDRTVKCWATKRSWGLVAAQTGFEDKVTAVDCSADGKTVVSACYDKTWKVWSSDP